MAEDNKRSKLSLPDKGPGTSQSRHRTALRGGSNPRAVREGRIGHGENGGDREFHGRSGRPDSESRHESYGDRPQRFREDRPPRDDRRPRFGDRDEGRRKSYGDRPQHPREDRPPRDDRRPRFGDRDEGRSRDFGERRFGDRDEGRGRDFGERRPRQEYEGRRESYGDRPQRPREDRPPRDDRRPRFGDRDEGRGRDFGDRRPRRESFGDRPQRFREDHPRGERDDGFNDRPRRDSHVRVYRADESQDAYTRFREKEARHAEERPQFRDRGEEHRHTEDEQDFDPANAPRQGRAFSRSRGSMPSVAREEDGTEAMQAEYQPRHTEPDAPGSLRLSKRMSELGMCSRREADEYIERGWVKVDGEVVAELGHKVLPTQHIELDVIAEEMQMRRVTILINKPIGYVSGQAEDGYEPAVVLITAENHWEEDPAKRHFEPRLLHKLAPAGRLDIDSTGLLVLTQDGRVAKQIIGETSDVEKEYLVRVEGELIPEGLEMLRHGLELDGVELEPAKVSWQNEDQLRFVLHEGRKRQIRRMCELVGLRVIGLKRIRIGRIPLGKLPVGQWRYLGEHEEF